MTMREVDSRLRMIHVRRHNDIAYQAAFHGIKIPFKVNEESQKIEFTPAQDALLSNALKNAQARKRTEMTGKATDG